MSSIRLREAMWTCSAKTGQKVSQKDLGEHLYPESKPESQQIKVSKLVTGKTQNFDADTIIKICEVLGVDANFLFNIKPIENHEEKN